MIFGEQTVSKHALCDIADRLAMDVNMIFDHLAVLMNRPAFEEARTHIESNVVLTLNDVDEPIYNGTPCTKTIEVAKKIYNEHVFNGTPSNIATPLKKLAELNAESSDAERDVLLKELEDAIFFGDIIPVTLADEIECLIRIYGESSWRNLGCFFEGHRDEDTGLCDRDEIVIFLRNCRSLHNDGELDYDYETILSTLAHEIFVAYICFEYDRLFEFNKGVERFYFRTKLVVESLASYFEASFDHNHGLNRRAIELIDSWRKHAVLSYPFAAADRIWEDNDLFRKYFDIALIDFVPAYMWLVYHTHTKAMLTSNRFSETIVVLTKLGELLLDNRLNENFINFYSRSNSMFSLGGRSLLVRCEDLRNKDKKHYTDEPISLLGEIYYLNIDWNQDDLDKLMDQGF